MYICLLGGLTITAVPQWKTPAFVANVLFCIAGLAFLGLIAASIWNLIKKRWGIGVINIFLVFGCAAATVFAFGFLMFASMFGPSGDGFADNLTIPAGIEIAEPEPGASEAMGVSTSEGIDEFKDIIRKALAVPGDDATDLRSGVFAQSW